MNYKDNERFCFVIWSLSDYGVTLISKPTLHSIYEGPFVVNAPSELIYYSYLFIKKHTQ